MRSAFLSLTLPITLLTLLGNACARDIVIPAGTLLQCTLDEPNFSSATADIGDPVLCHPRAVSQFGQAAFPRGTYLVGHLEAEKNPGHFVGKGYLKLEFDRIGLPNTDLPLPGKVIAVRGYHVDREGKIIGHGHPTRDVVEWMIPPLWPWKIITLPARGPRPTLKGETALTMRLMDDVAIPQSALDQWHRFGQPPSNAFYEPPRSDASVKNVAAPAIEFRTAMQTVPREAPGNVATPPVTLALVSSNSSAVDAPPPPAPSWHYYGQRNYDQKTVAEAAPTQEQPAHLTLFALKTGSVYAVTDYWVDNGSLAYVLSNGSEGNVDLQAIDWSATTQLNSERNVRVTLRSGLQSN
jgi:hypothetical protein